MPHRLNYTPSCEDMFFIIRLCLSPYFNHLQIRFCWCRVGVYEHYNRIVSFIARPSMDKFAIFNKVSYGTFLLACGLLLVLTTLALSKIKISRSSIR